MVTLLFDRLSYHSFIGARFIDTMNALFENHILIAAFLAWAIAQVSKTLYELIRERKLILSRLVSSGGMPSSHSALVTGLATATGRIDGLGSAMFAIAFVLAAIVMYDAAGVRRQHSGAYPQPDDRRGVPGQTFCREASARVNRPYPLSSLHRRVVGRRHRPAPDRINVAAGKTSTILTGCYIITHNA
jgi:hypothetical protein